MPSRIGLLPQVAMALARAANAVYHPADCALLSGGVLGVIGFLIVWGLRW